MNTILSKNVKNFLYNHQIPQDFSYFIQSLLITELGMEMKMEKERPEEFQEKIKIYGKTYPIHKVLFALVEYIKFIVLNNSRGNYNINRGFVFEGDIINHKQDYCLYLKYIFDTIGIHLDIPNIQNELGKKRLINGEPHRIFLIYDFIEDYILQELKKINEKGLIQFGTNQISLTNYPNSIYLKLGFKKNGVEAYYDISNEYRNMYIFMKELSDLRSVEHTYNNEIKKKIHDQKLNLYYDLWYTTKYARAKNRNASNEELDEIKTEHERFYKNKGIYNIKPLAEKQIQFLEEDSEIIEYEI